MVGSCDAHDCGIGRYLSNHSRGEIFTFIILILGLGIIAVPTGMVASALAKARKEEDEHHPGAKEHEEADDV